MKTLFILIANCCFFFFQITAQPLLDPMMFPHEGIGVLMVSPIDTLNSDEGPAGADVVWDFNHWTPDPETYLVLENGNLNFLTNPSAFPDATMGQIKYDTIITEEYYQKTPTMLSLVGIWAANQPLVYSDFELLLMANMAYNDTFTDTYMAQRQGADYDYVLSGEKWTNYDAYGILKIQGSSIPNVIRLHTEQTWRDTFFYENGTVHLRSFDRTAYQWYYTFKCGPDVAFYYTTKHEETWLGNVLVDSSTTPQLLHKTMLNGCSHAKIKEIKTLQGIKINLLGANPVHEVLNLIINSETAGQNLQVQVFDQFSRLIEERSISTTGSEQRLEIHVAQLANGLYVVSLTDGKGRVSKRWVKM